MEAGNTGLPEDLGLLGKEAPRGRSWELKIKRVL